MGDGETPAFAEAMVLQKAKQIALEEAGTYVQSYTKVQNLDLTKEEIVTIAGGVLETEILKRDRSLIGNGMQFDIKIKATVTTDRMEDLARKLRGNDLVEGYKKLQQQYAVLMRELESVKSSLAQLPTGPTRDAALDTIREQEKNFRALQQDESAFYKRLVSGETLFAKALSQVSQKENEREIVDTLSNRLLKEGFVISLGEPNIEATLQNRDAITLKVPVMVTVPASTKTVVANAASRLGETGVARLGKTITFMQMIPGSVVKLARDAETYRRFQRTVSKFVLLLEAHGDSASLPLHCYVSPEFHLSSLGISTGHWSDRYWQGSDLFHPDTPDSLYIPDATKLEAEEGYLMLSEKPVTFTAQMVLPLGAAKRITSLTGKMVIRESSRQRILGTSDSSEKCKITS